MTRADDLAGLGTEQIRTGLEDLDTWSAEDLVAAMCADLARLPALVDRSRRQIAHAVDEVAVRMERGGRLIYIGAGTAGRLGLLDAAEAGPTFNVDPGQVLGVLAGGGHAFQHAVENAEDDAAAGRVALESLGLSGLDAVVGVSASGRTPYVLGALEWARERGALTVALACNEGSQIGAVSEIAIEVPVGPELIAGSTRLNAGTIQKVVLNILSTSVMVRLGKTHGNLMVDVRATNHKLRERAERIVAAITGAPSEAAHSALEATGWRAKAAVLVLAAGLAPSEAVARLDRHGGRLRAALADRGGTTRPASAGRRLGVAAALVDGEIVEGDVVVAEGDVVAVGVSSPGEGLALPGLVDAQVNGYAGVDLLDADLDALAAMGRALAADGVFAYQPTLITAEPSQTRRALQRLDEARARSLPGARILPAHLEGPFLSPSRSGTHPVAHLRAADRAVAEELLAGGAVGMITIAPELPGALELISWLRERVVVSLGHSAADAAQAHAGFEAGARAVTHLFNAMEPLGARRPGLVGAALGRAEVAVQVIADGVHLAPETLALVVAVTGERLGVVSDAISAAGQGDGRFRLGEVEVEVREGVARRGDGTLAGGVSALHQALPTLLAAGADLRTAARAITWRPARMLGRSDLGHLSPGGRADLVVVGPTGHLERVLGAGRDLSA